MRRSSRGCSSFLKGEEPETSRKRDFRPGGVFGMLGAYTRTPAHIYNPAWTPRGVCRAMCHIWMLLIPALRSPPCRRRYAAIPRAIGITRLKGSRRTLRVAEIRDSRGSLARDETKGFQIEMDQRGLIYPFTLPLSLLLHLLVRSCLVFYPVCLFSCDVDTNVCFPFFEIFTNQLSSVLSKW